jgi:cell division protein FtsB
MAVWREIKRRARDVVGPVLGFCIVGYFAYHSVEGDRGLTAFVRLNERIAEARGQLDELRGERQAIERRVKHLRSDSLDADLLEERARMILNYGRPDEIVIFEKEPR